MGLYCYWGHPQSIPFSFISFFFWSSDIKTWTWTRYACTLSLLASRDKTPESGPHQRSEFFRTHVPLLFQAKNVQMEDHFSISCKESIRWCHLHVFKILMLIQFCRDELLIQSGSGLCWYPLCTQRRSFQGCSAQSKLLPVDRPHITGSRKIINWVVKVPLMLLLTGSKRSSVTLPN